jgi:hypothetical protein
VELEKVPLMWRGGIFRKENGGVVYSVMPYQKIKNSNF